MHGFHLVRGECLGSSHSLQPSLLPIGQKRPRVKFVLFLWHVSAKCGSVGQRERERRQENAKLLLEMICALKIIRKPRRKVLPFLFLSQIKCRFILSPIAIVRTGIFIHLFAFFYRAVACICACGCSGVRIVLWALSYRIACGRGVVLSHAKWPLFVK